MPGRALWREMKAGASLPFDPGQAGSQTLATFIDAFSKSGKPKKLYLVSRAFEEVTPAKILGMEDSNTLLERRNIPRLSVHYSRDDVPRARVTASESHGGFDHDLVTMNHLLRRVLKQKPSQEFTREILKY